MKMVLVIILSVHRLLLPYTTLASIFQKIFLYNPSEHLSKIFLYNPSEQQKFFQYEPSEQKNFQQNCNTPLASSKIIASKESYFQKLSQPP